MGLFFRLFRLFASGNFRGIFTLLLGLTLVWGLWETSLVRISSRDTATAVMTEVGVELINPLLTHNSLGLSQNVYGTLEKAAQAHPTQSFSVPGIKIKLVGSDIAGKSFDEGMTAIYAKVADAYYDNGAQGVFDVPSQLTSVLGQISLLPQLAASQGAKAAGVPQLPQVPLPPLGVIGLSPQLLTADGHTQAVNVAKWLLGAAAIFALLLMVFSPRLHRISSVAWSLLTGALPGVLVLGIIWFFWNRSPDLFHPYAQLLTLLGQAVVPVYGGAFALGAVGLVGAKVGDLALKAAGVGKRAPAAVGAFAGTRASAGAAYGGAGQRSWNEQPETPRYRPYGSGAGSSASGGGSAWGQQDRTWDMPPAAAPQRQPSSGYSAASYGAAGYGGSSAGYGQGSQGAQGGQAWPPAGGAQGGWDAPAQGQGGWGQSPSQGQGGGWGQPGQGGQGGQAGWPPTPQAPQTPQSGWPQGGQTQGQGGWGQPAQGGYGQSGQMGQGRPQGQAGGLGQGRQGQQQRGGWPPAGGDDDDDPWAPRR